nr:hypothetical protein [Candidatus Freyarchaeota archaeon]
MITLAARPTLEFGGVRRVNGGVATVVALIHAFPVGEVASLKNFVWIEVLSVVRLCVSLTLLTIVMTAFASCCVFSLMVFPRVSSTPWGLGGVQAGSGPFNLSLGVAVSGELSGQNPEDWYYIGILMIWRTSVLMAISMMVR